MPHYALPRLRDVEKAYHFISHKIIKTPVQISSHLSQIATTNLRLSIPQATRDSRIELFLKCENFQRTGSFKFRGASHFLARLSNYELRNGVVAYSTGNHAQAVAHAAQLASQERNIPIPAYVIVPRNCPVKKINAAKGYGASVFLCGSDPGDRTHLAARVQESTGSVLVPPADHLNIALGQATAIQELLQQVAALGHNQLDAIIVPSGGGGLLVGAAAVCRPRGILVFGAEPKSGGPRLAEARLTGTRTTSTGRTLTIADGLRSLTGEANWEIIKHKKNVEEVLMASEEEIKDALRLAIGNLGFVIEPSAAVPLAVALFNSDFQRRVAGKRHVKVGVVLTGCNISEEDLKSLLPGLRLKKTHM